MHASSNTLGQSQKQSRHVQTRPSQIDSTLIKKIPNWFNQPANSTGKQNIPRVSKIRNTLGMVLLCFWLQPLLSSLRLKPKEFDRVCWYLFVTVSSCLFPGQLSKPKCLFFNVFYCSFMFFTLVHGVDPIPLGPWSHKPQNIGRRFQLWISWLCAALVFYKIEPHHLESNSLIFSI